MPTEPASPKSPRADSDRVKGVERSSSNVLPQAHSSGTVLSSEITDSSDITYSDKLSALPVSSPSPRPNRTRRSPILGGLNRRSIDASSLPSSPSRDESNMSPRLKNTTIFPRASASDDSIFNNRSGTVREGRDYDRSTSFSSVRQAFGRLKRTSDPAVPSPGAGGRLETPSHGHHRSRSPSPSPSRAASPLRLLQHLSAGMKHHVHQHEDPFVPVNPFLFSSGSRPKRNARGIGGDMEAQAVLPHQTADTWFSLGRELITDTFPRIVYLYFLLSIPSMYFTRVAYIFQDAEVSRPDIQRMIEAAVRNDNSPRTNYAVSLLPVSVSQTIIPPMTVQPLPFPDEWAPGVVSPSLLRFKHSWEAFIDSLLREWKTLNVVSALLASAIMTIFQVPSAGTDPLTRTASLLSLICALMSLTYGCMYIVRFGTMRSMYRASRWAEEARKTHTAIWWNAWVLLAMPGVWMAWSMCMFLLAILSFTWRTGGQGDPSDDDPWAPLPFSVVWVPRVIITAVFLLGIIYLFLIIRTLKNYGKTLTHPIPPHRPPVQSEVPLRPLRGRGMERISSHRREESLQRRMEASEGRQNTLKQNGDGDRAGVIGLGLEVDLEKVQKERSIVTTEQ